MRLFEFAKLDEYSGKTPLHEPFDQDSGLHLNTDVFKWKSSSPYLYAVKNPNGTGYLAQIHIPADFYQEHLKDLQQRWPNPERAKSMFNDISGNRYSLKAGPFADPRQAAWFAQQLLIAGNNDNAEEILLGKITSILSNDKSEANGWNDLLHNVPSFSGEPKSPDEADEYFKTNRLKIDQETQAKKDAHKERVSLDTNANKLGGGYDARMVKIIKAAWNEWAKKMGPAVMKKKFGKELTIDQLDARLNNEIEQRGVEFFMTGPKSVKPKNPSDVKI